MIPLKLTLEGIYSYQQRQEIDFSHLTDAGLFGIFGKVGSGKSSILEAISYAIYGETERMNSREKRSYNMLNLKSKRAFISLEFANFENKIFKINRELKRNSKNFEDVKTEVVFYELKDGNWVPIEHSDGEKITGISYENFKRTIIIPQGQFREFLELSAMNRTKMMKELFGLQRFDLDNSTKILVKENKEKLDFANGKLDGLESTDDEKIADLHSQAENLATEKAVWETNFNESEAKIRALEIVKTDSETLAKKQKYQKSLLENQPKIKEKEAETNLYEKAEKIFAPLFSKKKETEKSLKNISEKNNEQEGIFAKSVKELEDIDQKISKIKPDFDNLPESRKAENDLKILAQNSKLRDEIKSQKERRKNGETELGKLKKTAEENSEKFTNLQNEIKLLNAEKLDSELLINLGKWYQEDLNFRENLDKSSKILQKIVDRISVLQNQKSALENEISGEDFNLNNLQENLRKLTEARTQLQVQQRIAEFSHNLENGEPCPLCGSLEHPNIAAHENVSVKISEIESKISDLEKKIKSVDTVNNQLQITENELNTINFQKTETEAEFEKIQSLKNSHRQNFVWKDFEPANSELFIERKNKSLATEKTIAEKNSELEKLKSDAEIFTKKLEKFSDEIRKIDSEIASRNAIITSNQNNLEVLKSENYADKEAEEITSELGFLQKKNNETERIYNELLERQKQFDRRKDAAMQAMNIFLDQISGAKELLHQLEKELESSLEKENFEDLNFVEKILSNPLDIQKNRDEITAFNFEIQQVAKEISELEANLNGAVFSEENYLLSQKNHSETKENLRIISENFTKISHDLRRIQDIHNSKKSLLEEISALEKRQENLRILQKLFQAEGFVQYVSSVQLRQLCDAANERFHKMTRNSLSLFLNDQNDFEVIDYLNEGRHRSVKTLSGGQSFQAALCLALALAEHAQTNSKSGKNFFFIDEGFGTQDSDSVNVIFETLQRLLKENRIVGIISHVEELKEQIPAAILVEKDDQKGSLISVI